MNTDSTAVIMSHNSPAASKFACNLHLGGAVGDRAAVRREVADAFDAGFARCLDAQIASDPYMGKTLTADQVNDIPEGYLVRDKDGDLSEIRTNPKESTL